MTPPHSCLSFTRFLSADFLLLAISRHLMLLSHLFLKSHHDGPGLASSLSQPVFSAPLWAPLHLLRSTVLAHAHTYTHTCMRTCTLVVQKRPIKIHLVFLLSLAKLSLGRLIKVEPPSTSLAFSLSLCFCHSSPLRPLCLASPLFSNPLFLCFFFPFPFLWT